MKTRLGEAMESVGITNRELEKKSGYSFSQIAAVRKGQQFGSVQFAQAVAPYLGVSPAWLLGLSEFRTEKEIFIAGVKEGMKKAHESN